MLVLYFQDAEDEEACFFAECAEDTPPTQRTHYTKSISEESTIGRVLVDVPDESWALRIEDLQLKTNQLAGDTRTVTSQLRYSSNTGELVTGHLSRLSAIKARYPCMTVLHG